MKSYNETIDKLERDIDRIYNIAYSLLREKEYKAKDEFIKSEMDRVKLSSASLICDSKYKYELETKDLSYKLEDLFKTRESAFNSTRILYDNE